MEYKTIKVRFQDSICFIQLNRPEANNAINDSLVKECLQVLEQCEEAANIVVLEGLPEVFCNGADFKEISENTADGEAEGSNPDELYELWQRLAAGSFISIAVLRGRVNAGGVGFAAACDIVLADKTVQFSLSELLFGLFPACVMPFLVRRIGFQKANYMTLTTQPVLVEQAEQWGLVDVVEEKVEVLLRKHLLRLRRLSKKSIVSYKSYANKLNDLVTASRKMAVQANKEIFSDKEILGDIKRYVNKGKFPWDK